MFIHHSTYDLEFLISPFQSDTISQTDVVTKITLKSDLGLFVLLLIFSMVAPVAAKF